MKESKVESIRKHVEKLNHELGVVQNEVKWIKKIMIYIALVLTSVSIKLFLSSISVKGG